MASCVSLEYVKKLYGNGNAGFTDDGGLYVTLINQTGALTQKGTIVTASPVQDGSVNIAPPNSDQALGVVLEDNVAIGAPVKIAISGISYVLLKDGTTGTRNYWCGVSDVAGRMYQDSISPIAQAEHSRQIGQSLQNVSAGSNVLCMVYLNFN